MQQFTVPQFIDIEDKIFGPLTIRQFLITLAGFAIVAISYKLFTFTWFVVTLVFVFVCTTLLAFFRVNGMPMHFFILNFVESSKKPVLRVWNNSYHMNQPFESEDEVNKEIVEVIQKKSYTTSRLNELSLVVDTTGTYMGENSTKDEQIKTIQHRKLKRIVRK